MSNAILFGSIGTIADTSELQRSAFNQAFQQHGLDWHWAQAEYQSLLQSSGGRQRIADYAKSKGQEVDAAAIHQTKSQFFQRFLDEGKAEPRPGVTDVIQQAKADGLKLALVTTTSPENVAAMLNALGDRLSAKDFDLVLDGTKVAESKPSPEAYHYTLKQLGTTADRCVAIEDNVDGVEAAIAAGLPCLAFPNQNTAEHDFSKAEQTVERLMFEQLQSRLLSGVSAS